MSTPIPIKKSTGEFNSPLFMKDLNTPIIYGTFGFFVTILCVITLALIFPHSVPTTSITGGKKIENNITIGTIIVTIIFAILAIILVFVPSYKDVLKIFINLKFTFVIILYCFGLIIFFRSMSNEFSAKYASVLSPITLLIGIILFYLAINTPSYGMPDISFERINYTITYFLLIVFMLLFYTLDPGGYVKHYFGPSLLITILLAIFGLLYVITIMTFPSTSTATTDSTATATTSFFKGFTWGGIISHTSFVVFLILLIIGILSFPGGFLNDKTGTSGFIIMMAIIIFSFWIFFTVVSMFSHETVPPGSISSINMDLSNINGIGRRIFALLFGLILSGLLIGWLVNITKDLSSASNIVALILNLLIIVFILSLIFKLVTVTSLYKNSPLFRLLISTVLYIPCLLVNIIDGGVTMFGGEYQKTPYTYYILLFIIILLYLVYFSIPYFTNSFAKQGGKLLLNQPIPLNSENIIGSYQLLNNSAWRKPEAKVEVFRGNTIDQIKGVEFNYTYGISFWTYIDAITSASDKYVSILNYGDKPNILYNSTKNILMITMKNTGEEAIGSVSRLSTPQQLDENGNIIIHKQSNVLLQKWNHIIINYNGGTLDIFLNGQLIKSVIEAIPKMEYDTLTVGAVNGVEGKICNVNYFDHSLTTNQIYYLYSFVKDKNPPISKDSKDTIIKHIPIEIIEDMNREIIVQKTDQITKKVGDTVQKTKDTIKNFYDPYSSTNVLSDYLSPKWYFTNNGDIYNG